MFILSAENFLLSVRLVALLLPPAQLSPKRIYAVPVLRSSEGISVNVLGHGLQIRAKWAFQLMYSVTVFRSGWSGHFSYGQRLLTEWELCLHYYRYTLWLWTNYLEAPQMLMVPMDPNNACRNEPSKFLFNACPSCPRSQGIITS